MGGCQQSPRKLGCTFGLAGNLSEQKRFKFNPLACSNWGNANKFIIIQNYNFLIEDYNFCRNYKSQNIFENSFLKIGGLVKWTN